MPENLSKPVPTTVNLPPTTKPNFWKIGFFISLCLVSVLILAFGATKAKLLSQLSQKENQIAELKSKTQKEPQEKSKFTPLKINSWQEFKDQNYFFSFKYPQDWIVQKSAENTTLSVSNYPESCKNCSQEEKKNYYEFHIQYLEELQGQERTNNALEYLLKDWLAFLNQQSKENTLLPMVPGFTQKYVDDENPLFNDQNCSAVEVRPYYFSPDYGQKDFQLVQNEYLVIDNQSRLYTINLISPGYASPENKPDIEEKEHPLIEIIKSLKFQ